jgi:nicotinamidase/pyrazinamidase
VDEAVAPEPGDFIVLKTTYSAFYGTVLEDLLREHRVSTVRLTGCVTHICILYTAMESSVRGFAVEVVRDGVAGLDPADHEFALKNMREVIGARLL